MAKKTTKKKAKRKPYFGIDVQEAVVRYNDETNPVVKNQIYRDEIAYAFDKLCENIINTLSYIRKISFYQSMKYFS